MGTKTEFSLSVRQQGKLHMMSAGQPAQILDNACFLVEPIHGGEYRVTPNESTAEGKDLKKLFDAVPAVPYQTDYPELLGDFSLKQDDIDKWIGVNGVVPRLQSLKSQTILVYNCDAGAKSDFCPPGSRRLDTALRVWLDNDESDQNRNIQPPPMPKELAKIFTAQFGATQTSEAHRPPAPQTAALKPPALDN